MWDKPNNHKNYGNVLFLDGRVQCFSGSDWPEQAKAPDSRKKGKRAGKTAFSIKSSNTP